jgi:hexosaminidase
MLPLPTEVEDDGDVYRGPPVETSAAGEAAVGLAAYRLGRPLPEPLSLDDEPPRIAGTEAFTLTIAPSHIRVAATGPPGRLYAVHALRQLVTLSEGSALPCGKIHDAPRLSDRGYMLDVSRNRVPTRAYLSELLDLLLLLRFNHLELYLEHTFAYRGHEAVWRGWSPLTAEDVQWLDDEAASRGIELVPNQNSFGHMTRWLEHEEYRRLAEAPNGFIDPWGDHRGHPFSLSPAAEGVEEFLSGLYDQLLPNFAGRRFNTGLDETFDLGQGRSASLIREDEDPKDARGRLYLSFLRRVHSLVTERGYTMLFWADVVQNHPDLVSQLPRDVVAIEWGYEEDHDFERRCRRLAEAELSFLVAPGTSLWNSAGGRYETARVNIRRAVAAAVKHRARGVLLTDWGDNGHLPPPLLAYPAIALGGALAWNPEGVATDATGHGALRQPTSLPDDAVFPWLGTMVFHAGRRRVPRGEDGLVEAMRLLNSLDRHDHRSIPNASILGVALLTFKHRIHAPFVGSTDPETMHKMRAQVRKARVLAAEATRLEQTRRLQQEEILFAADLADWALLILDARRVAEGREPVFAEETTRSELTSRHARLAERLDQVWLARSRPGGLMASRAVLARSMQGLS